MRMNGREIAVLTGTGVIIGAGGIALIVFGNPEYVGVCLSCFMINLAGALGLHSNPALQFPPPELIGFLLGAYLSALVRRQHYPRPSGDFMVRFMVGFFMMVGAAVFVGCPLRALFRLGFGDFSALIGMAGFVAGIWFGTGFERTGFFLCPVVEHAKERAGWLLPLIGAAIFTALAIGGAGLRLSQTGPAAVHAPILATLLFGLVVGALGQRSRFCAMAAVRNFIIGRDVHLLIGLAAVVIAASLANRLSGKYMAGLWHYPGTHTAYVWDFISLFLVGLAAVFANGCPFRTVIRAGQGDTDAVPVLMGMMLAGGITETFGIVSTTAGITKQGKIGVLAGIIFLIIIGWSRVREESIDQSLL